MSAFLFMRFIGSELLPGGHGLEPCRQVADDSLLARLKAVLSRSPQSIDDYFLLPFRHDL